MLKYEALLIDIELYVLSINISNVYKLNISFSIENRMTRKKIY